MSDYEIQPHLAEPIVIRLNHRLRRLTDYTEGLASGSALSVSSVNLCPSVIQTMPGYKQTEVGVIPEEWAVERLDEGALLALG